MDKATLKLIALISCLLLLLGCAPPSQPASQLRYAAIKRNFLNNKLCINQHKLDGISRPTRGVIEGSGSFTTPSWELYIFDLDGQKLSKIESVWAFEDGKMTVKPNKLETININSSEIQTVVALANLLWASDADTPSLSITDTAWNIQLIDGLDEKCESARGAPRGNGGSLTKIIYSIWKSNQTN
ncbi:hypothetical protein [uncultured Caballeronia sp.]|jgi:hypothetical protein|uniref:hypothetical protein n=1 Tax=uncultured Caballeronia sp. TaxID=1827198 RepID=UPI0015756E09